MGLLKLLGFNEDEAADFGDLYTFVSSLSDQLPERTVRVATGIAGLLGQVAYADSIMADEEVSAMTRALTDVGGLSRAMADSVVQMVLGHKAELLLLQDHFYYRLLNQNCDSSEKARLVGVLVDLAAADGAITVDEETVLARIVNGLHVPPKVLADHKRRHAAVLSTLQCS